MSNAVKNIMLRAIRKRLAEKSLEEIWTSYPRLTLKEREELKAELEANN